MRKSAAGPPLQSDEVIHTRELYLREIEQVRAVVRHWVVDREGRVINLYALHITTRAGTQLLLERGYRTQLLARDAMTRHILTLCGHQPSPPRPKRRRGGTDWLRAMLQRLALGALDLDNPQLTAEEEQGLAILMAAQVRRGSKILKQREESQSAQIKRGTKRAGGHK